mmetsp:Transcript_73410/g.163019  ORF Transcript_73410/g.163019 Transcript_73410/m.163019 type:complete len:81 (+) Transcript_73410:1090-1332(+)
MDDPPLTEPAASRLSVLGGGSDGGDEWQRRGWNDTGASSPAFLTVPQPASIHPSMTSFEEPARTGLTKSHFVKRLAGQSR